MSEAQRLIYRSIIKAVEAQTDAILDDWRSKEDGTHIYIDGDGNPSYGAAAYDSYAKESSAGGAKSSDFSNYSPNSDIGKCLERLEDELVPITVEELSEARTDEQIISSIAGGDLTDGSCASAALAYIGQQMGYDVGDFRGDANQWFFSRNSNLAMLKDLPGVDAIVPEEAENTLDAAYEVMFDMIPGTEYYLVAGDHAAIVRQTEGRNGKLQYLELQSGKKSENGWTDFGKYPEKVLKGRFGCSSEPTQKQTFAIDTDELKANTDEMRYILGYINTPEEYQQKSDEGYAK